MLLLIAWRNIWRSRTRSLVVIGAVFLGVWSFISLMAFTNSMVLGYVKNAIRYQTSHLQMHNPAFLEDQEVEFTLPNGPAMRSALSNDAQIKAFAERTLVYGMVRSSRAASGIQIRGVQPTLENEISGFADKITQGKYFSEKKNEILISERLAEKLKLKLRKKLVLQFQDFNNEISQGSFRVVGIFKTGNTMLDLGMVMVKQNELNGLLGKENIVHEFAMLLEDPDQLNAVQERYQSQFAQAKVENYREVSPDVQLYEQQLGISSVIFLTIFMLALIFGIINTMLMAVLERNKEIGMLMAVGMNKLKVFGMIFLETVLLALIGAPIGMFVGWLTVNHFAKNGIDLGAFAEGIERFGLSTVLRPELPTEIYLQLMFAVFLTAILASIYPAIKAIRLKPVEAIHKI